MDPKTLARALLWLAVLGGTVLIASKVLGKAAGRASGATPHL